VDAVVLSNFIVPMYIGLTEEERMRPQRIRIDVAIETDFSDVISTGCLERGVNYAHVRRDIREIAASEPFVLLEMFGNRIVQKLLEGPNVLRVKLRIRKLDRWKDAIPGIKMSRRR
jgi:dihydroneopterin aldolase